ncbi:MAG TPA: hypothetical protein VHT24_17520 [Pseudacidobacterium sp.]|jgi:hypothetical protein|nr:hypothetical protein [Pseudacidobacterium sp.]
MEKTEMDYFYPTENCKTDIEDAGYFPSLHSMIQLTRSQGTGCPRAATELSNEAFCFWLANYIGLPVDTWQRWSGTQNPLMSLESGLWFEGNKNYTAPVARVCHASWLPPGIDSNQSYEIIPSKWQPRVTNRSDFLGMAMFDVWGGAQRYRQAIYIGWPDRTLRALFLSHGKMFNIQGDDGTIRYKPQLTGLRSLLMAHRHALGEWTEEAIAGWAEKLRGLDSDCLQQAFDYACSEWQPDGWEDDVREFIARRHVDIDLIAEAMQIELKQMK